MIKKIIMILNLLLLPIALTASSTKHDRNNKKGTRGGSEFKKDKYTLHDAKPSTTAFACHKPGERVRTDRTIITNSGPTSVQIKVPIEKISAEARALQILLDENSRIKAVAAEIRRAAGKAAKNSKTSRAAGKDTKEAAYI